ncbi:MAG: tRNA (5-methylaminomethyl-2-thiouridine)(34)-methyltransferase MnmD, partial [Gemmobacter sp.]
LKTASQTGGNRSHSTGMLDFKRLFARSAKTTPPDPDSDFRPSEKAEGLEAEVIVGDVRQTLPAWPGRADAWFLDGFSPAKNPEMWGAALMAEVAAHTAPGGTFATYTAAGHVRRALQAAGFQVTRSAGFGAKRHMSAGRLG